MISTEITGKDYAVLITGGMNAKEKDQYMERSDVRPVLLLADGRVEPVPFFDSWGKLGVSSMAWPGKSSPEVYVAPKDDVYCVDLSSGEHTQLPIPNLQDIHEIDVIGSTLWIANTGYDQAVGFDLATNEVVRRVSLRRSAEGPVPKEYPDLEAGDSVEVDRFHLNQIFRGYDDQLYGLVHHTDGRQLLRRVADKVIKSHGNGGVVQLSQTVRHDLGLRAPHNVRRVGGDYWVFSSGDESLKIYDRKWDLREKIEMAGWGRGAALSPDGSLLFAGISETRKRYLALGSDDNTPNTVEVFDVEDRTRVTSRVVAEPFEQINNLYIVPRPMVDLFINLPS